MEKLSNPKDLCGVKKAPMSTIPMPVIAEVGLAMLEGACKYGRHNYRGVGVRGSVYFDATMRHLISWWEGEDIDPDSELSHITKAISSLVVLRDAMMQGKFEDDRPPRSINFYAELNKKAGQVIERYAHLSPKHYTEIEKTIAPDSDGWVEWNGGAFSPVNGELFVVIRTRGGAVQRDRIARAYRWNHLGKLSDILAYRVDDER